MILSAMQQHKRFAVIQEQGCCALRNIAGNEDNRVKLAEAGAIQVILGATEQHPTSPGVQLYACWALSVLSMNDTNRSPHPPISGSHGSAVPLCNASTPAVTCAHHPC